MSADTRRLLRAIGVALLIATAFGIIVAVWWNALFGMTRSVGSACGVTLLVAGLSGVVSLMAAGDGRYVWCYDFGQDGASVGNAMHLRPPLPQPPAELGEVWVNVNSNQRPYVTGHSGSDKLMLDLMADRNRIGRCKLDLSTWVPCNGKEVLA